MSAPAIEIRNISKRYRLGTAGAGYGRMTEAISHGLARLVRRSPDGGGRARDVIWALRDVDLTVAEGEVVGIIGRNGAGKTTLLKILSRITEPTAGRALIHGRVGALLEVGTGFHPELTGSENIYLNGALIGMRRQEIRAKFDEIVEFAEIGRFIETPVKRYSSGMYVRLAFAVAAHLEPEILIIDEVLAVGDVAFQRKCLGKMDAVAKTGRTVLFVSHNMGAVRSLCSRAVVIEDGRVVHDGSTNDAVSAYLATVGELGGARATLPERGLAVQVTEMWVEDERGDAVAEIALRGDATLVLSYVVSERLRDVTLAVLVSAQGTPVLYSYDTDSDESLREYREAGRYMARVPLPMSLFKEGIYTLSAWIGAGRENLSDPRASLNLIVVNHDEDLTHRSYRADRPGYLVCDLPWHTERI